jgi:hypothetical protein
MLNARPCLRQGDIHDHVANAVDTFMRALGTCVRRLSALAFAA